MKRVCFVEMEGILIEYKGYVPDKKRIEKFSKELTSFCKKEKIDLYLLSGLHKKVATKKFESSILKKYFSKEKFLFVDNKYIEGKEDVDEQRHHSALEKDSEFEDSYFKQVAINKIMEKDKVLPSDILLLCNDVWVDGYYTVRFSKVDFAIFNENLLERGNPIEYISGLAYFSLDFKSVKILLKKFPELDLNPLNKFIFDTMQKILLNDVDFSRVVKKAFQKKKEPGVGGLDETKID